MKRTDIGDRTDHTTSTQHGICASTEITMQNRMRRMRRLLASGLLPKRAGQPVKALVHVSFADLCALDQDSALQWGY